jgi:hypothetical protein
LKREIKDLNKYLGDTFDLLIDMCKLRPVAPYQWREWIDDWGNELYIKTRIDFEIRHVDRIHITDIYFLASFEEIERISVARTTEDGYLGLLGRDSVLRVYKDGQRISPLAIGLPRLQKMINSFQKELNV